MQEQDLFEYAVIRVVPRVEREEFLNVGIILLCSRQKFIGTCILMDEKRLKSLCPGVDLDVLKEHIVSFERVCAGGPQGGQIGLLSIAERFRWLTASRSTVIQTSKVHPGLCIDAQQMLAHLVKTLVECSE